MEHTGCTPSRPALSGLRLTCVGTRGLCGGLRVVSTGLSCFPRMPAPRGPQVWEVPEASTPRRLHRLLLRNTTRSFVTRTSHACEKATAKCGHVILNANSLTRPETLIF